MAFFCSLPHRALIAVHGEDRIAFLQSLVSNDMAKVENGAAVWAAFLTPQGKFLHEFFAVPQGDAVLLECERARREDLITRLSRYRLRAKATVAAAARAVAVAWGEDAASALETAGEPGMVKVAGGGVLYTDPRVAGAGVRAALDPDQIAAWSKLPGMTAATPAAYDAHRMALGLPDGSRDMEIEKALLLENGFAELQGVDFKKGCYIGQELTARTHYRALIKKRLMPVTIAGTANAGAALTAGGDDAGELKSVEGAHGLALVRLEAWRKAPGGVLDADGAKVTPVVPAWMHLPEG
ncbi:MAG: folate-binding protein [Rhodospirillaceae bacterium]|nr:folate-binding protein [Rhodospirillaceae bacterium]